MYPEEFEDQKPFQPFATVEFAENPEPRCPCVLLLDTSSSMQGRPIQELAEGLERLRTELLGDAMAQKRVEIGVITFGPVRRAAEFTTVDQFEVPPLSARGDTPLGAAVEAAIAMVRERKDQYRQAGVAYFRPWIFLITDGAPTDDWSRAAEAVREGEAGKAFSFFAVGVEQADMDVLRRLSVRPPQKLEGLKFGQLFQWLSSSLAAVSHSRPDDAVILPAPESWTRID